ncbi:EDD domain protein, DegV family [Desulfosporosinus orientis DSM 765]|uniref:EDD domain protein, DegV family n=1 Tax=Desulfosporosinus orientis (strain ATCC 19365 / DSM 765 / NCIMB 8382 / VKM B-1628 / Singapore I) TaxID=768706 RepID=G7W975_DESOD|nr:DegV family protein [Desulfosporosinus orientis]AET68716.1 EDD domain protein, DegV family [Desulfosporosinus orientis DSM 765]
MSFKVLVDSSSDIPKNKAASAGIITVPMPVTIDGKTYLEGIDLQTEDFYAQFASFKELPKTSQPNLNMLLEHYEQVLAEGHEVVAIHLSSGLSSTVATAKMISETTSAPDRVHVIDSLGASFGYGLLALLAQDIVQSAASWEEAEAKILQCRKSMRYIFTLDTLEYLVMGGRVSKSAGFIGGLLDVKPVLHITSEGHIEPFAKVRTRRAAIRKLVDIMEQEIQHPEEQVIGISHSACLNEANLLAQEIRERLKVKDIWISEIGCVIGSHTGPGTLALFYRV